MENTEKPSELLGGAGRKLFKRLPPVKLYLTQALLDIVDVSFITTSYRLKIETLIAQLKGITKSA